ncbi:hypothetical protein IKG60_00380 [Candidatus Saccharibacteria bacterium]|nr:hypothetical protein [Candidatus Saccharibacteria bacterium]
MIIIKRWGLVAITMFVFMLVAFSLVSDTFAADDSANGDVLHSVTMTYDQDVVDIYNNAYVVSIDDQKDITLDFDVEEGFYGIKKILLRDITEDGNAKNVCETVTKQCSFNATALTAGSGLEIVLYDWDDNVVRQTMLGLIIKQNATKEDFEIPITMGPPKEISIDMGTISTGMNFSLSPIPIPVKYEHYPDGRSVIGLGTNSTDKEFWEDAEKDNMKDRISKSDMYQKWKDTLEHQQSGKGLGLVWSVSGYATSYDNHPEKMTGTLQFYVGSGYNIMGQYAIFTYSITITYGANGEFTFLLFPKDEQRFNGNLDLDLSAGVELYGGIGSGWLASVGIYGSAKLGAGFHVLPEFDFYKLNIAGEIGLKAKVLGRTVATFTFVKGSHDFINNKTETNDMITYASDLRLRDTMLEKRDELIANNYGSKPAGAIEAQTGETTWNLENLDQPTKVAKSSPAEPVGFGGGPSLDTTSAVLTDAPHTQISNNYDYAHRIAENIYPHSGLQIIKHPTNELSAVAVFANNNGELNYSIYDGSAQQMSQPQVVAGTDGQDFDAKFTRGFYPGQSYLTWRRLTDDGSNGATLTDVAKSGEIMIAQFDPDTNTFTGQENVTSDSNYIYGGVGVTTGRNEDDREPYVFAYTNDDADPEGLVDGERKIMLFRKNGDGWDGNVIKSYIWGTIASFDVGIYDGKPSAAYTLWNDFADVVITYVIDAEGELMATFTNAWGAQFTTKNGEPVLTFMEDGKLYSSAGGNEKTLEFGEDNKSLPNAPFKIVGDLGETFMVSYLSNVDSRQNLVGYVKANGVCGYDPVLVTNVAENSNVTYYAGLFIGNSTLSGSTAVPFIIYTVQNYEYVDPEWVEGQADMYAMSGAATNHVSILAADITNLRNLGVDTNVAKVDVLLKNSGLFQVDKFSLYLKGKDESSDQYVKLADYEIPTLSPGDIYQLELELPEADYNNPRAYVLGATSRNDDYADIGIQSEYLVDASAGSVQIVGLKYDFHDRGNHDAYTVTAKSLGPGHKNGKLVYYNTIDKTVYKEVSFSDLGPGDEIVDTIENSDIMLSANHEHLAVRVASATDAASSDDNWPTDKFRHMELLPAWFNGYINKVGGRSADGQAVDGDDIIVPDTGEFTQAAIATAVSGSAALVVMSVSVGVLWLGRRNRRI